MSERLWVMVAALAMALAILTWSRAPAARLGSGRKPRHWGGPRLRQSAMIAASSLPLAIGLGWWAVPIGVGVGVASHLVLGRLEGGWVARRRELLVASLPQACDLMAVCLQSGLPLRVAAAEVAGALEGPLGGILSEVTATVRLGADEAAAWAKLADVDPVLAPLGREVARTIGSGVALAATLRALGLEARRRRHSEAQVRARRVGVRSVLPLMVCFLPSFMLLGVVPIIGGVVRHLFG